MFHLTLDKVSLPPLTPINDIKEIEYALENKLPLQITRYADNAEEANLWLRSRTTVMMTTDSVAHCSSEEFVSLCNVAPKGVAKLFLHSARLQSLVDFIFLKYVAKHVTEKSLISAVATAPACKDLTQDQILILSSLNLSLGLEILKFHKPHLIKPLLENLPDKLTQEMLTEMKYLSRTGNDRFVTQLKRFEENATLLKTYFLTVEEYINYLLFSPIGYYGGGRVEFNIDFSTFSSEDALAKGLGTGFAYQLFANWQELIQNGTLPPDAKFNVLECGAGTGNLCYHILTTLEKMAKEHIQWAAFYEAINYYIIEISPFLADKQRQRNSKFKDKLTVINNDARLLKEALSFAKITSPMAVVFANELLDCFPQHEILCNEDNIFMVGMVAPSISETNLARLNLSAKIVNNLKKNSNKIKKEFVPFMAGIKSENVFLSKNDFRDILPLCVKQNLNIIKYYQFYLPTLFFPLITKYIKENSYLFAKAKPNEKFLVTLGTEKYLNDVKSLLMPGGELILVDYGASGHQPSPNFRTFKNRQLNFDIFANDPGSFDITGDVVFTHVANYGKKIGLTPIHYGAQHHLLPIDEKIIPASVLSLSEKHTFLKSNYVQGFNVLVQKNLPPSKINSALYKHSSRFFEPSHPITQEELLMELLHLNRCLKREIKITELLIFVIHNNVSLVLDYIRESIKDNLEESTPSLLSHK